MVGKLRNKKLRTFWFSNFFLSVKAAETDGSITTSVLSEKSKLGKFWLLLASQKNRKTDDFLFQISTDISYI